MYSAWLGAIEDIFDIWFDVNCDEGVLSQRIDELIEEIDKLVGEFDGYCHPNPQIIKNNVIIHCVMSHKAGLKIKQRLALFDDIMNLGVHPTGRGGGGGPIIYLLLPGDQLIPSTGYDDPPGY